MYRLSLIISEVYNKYLPLAEKGDIRLNLDFADTTQTVADPEEIQQSLDQHLDSALSRSLRGEVRIAVEADAIVITDSGTILSKPTCDLLSRGRVQVKSRVGFGTTARITLAPSATPTKAPAAPAKASTTPARTHTSTRTASAKAAKPRPKSAKK